MKLLRILLFPFAVIYWAITTIRNRLYDSGILTSHCFPIPVIAVGNLSVGGTGKTPQVEYLIRLLAPHFRVAVLSRGYKRKSTGFILADGETNADLLGDEPFQYHQKFKAIQVAVDADRVRGITKLLQLSPAPQLVLLDDAYQHRRVKAGLYILLTAYDELYSDDLLLPSGDLRESRSGACRAHIIVVTKCPPDLSAEHRLLIVNKLAANKGQHIFFSYIDYDETAVSKYNALPLERIRRERKLLIAGIAKPAPFFRHLKSDGDSVMEYPDHYDFKASDIAEIVKKASGGLIVTTEKDYVRLAGRIPDAQLFFVPIQSVFIEDAATFDRLLTDYVKSNLTD